jgi:hypothetical protein
MKLMWLAKQKKTVYKLREHDVNKIQKYVLKRIKMLYLVWAGVG